MHSLVRARVQYGSFEPPFIQGLLTRRVLAHIVEAITNEFEQNIRAAEAEEQRRPSSIVNMARELGLNPRPAGHNDKAWIANCPRTNHWLMIAAEQDEFGCGYADEGAVRRTFVHFTMSAMPGGVAVTVIWRVVSAKNIFLVLVMPSGFPMQSGWICAI